jgi:hypothetical protein
MIRKTVTMPSELSGENGGKYLMIGEFFEEVSVRCEECDDGCNECGFGGYRKEKIPVSWETIKQIYKKAVDHFAEQEAQMSVVNY